ncbi:hypothetical protein KOR42_14320 [Thalassoglobus neptunius]|uniref:peptidyl-tRNA hydrolase n=1 Tax=Thalassoglobus neptunius TaxID=1938619 RepID=A0A5C5X876_9PLAN|nr:peptidyl-tRNA hydrolase [Thalassoglobus neptunius]TWT58062.1 hypothetical protein KOR42_14320 [Thalassoglobus neptunius]
MKMYILIRESVPTGFALVSASHASLAAYLKFKDAPEIEQWLSGPFHKTICKVNDTEFETAKSYDDCVVITESALDGQEVAIAFKPREEWPKPFRFYSLYR